MKYVFMLLKNFTSAALVESSVTAAVHISTGVLLVTEVVNIEKQQLPQISQIVSRAENTTHSENTEASSLNYLTLDPLTQTYTDLDHYENNLNIIESSSFANRQPSSIAFNSYSPSAASPFSFSKPINLGNSYSGSSYSAQPSFLQKSAQSSTGFSGRSTRSSVASSNSSNSVKSANELSVNKNEVLSGGATLGSSSASSSSGSSPGSTNSTTPSSPTPTAPSSPAPTSFGTVTIDKFQRDISYRTILNGTDGSFYSVGTAGTGNTDIYLIKVKANGDLDTSFGSGLGYVITNLGQNSSVAYDIKLQADGKILVAGSASFAGQQKNFIVLRYLTDGSLDASWGTAGVVNTSISNFDDEALSIELQTDGKVLVAGYTSSSGSANSERLAVARYTTTGALDTTFATTGYSTYNPGARSRVHSLAVRTDGKIWVAGFIKSGATLDLSVARVNSDGTIDTTYGSSGYYSFDLGGDDQVNALKLSVSEEIYFTGSRLNGDQDLFVAKMTTAGTWDSSFGSSGFIYYDNSGADDSGEDLIIDSSNNVWVTGWTKNTNIDALVIKMNSSGQLSSDFEAAGVGHYNLNEDDYGYSIFLNTDNEVLIGGTSNFNGASNFDVFLMGLDNN